MIFIGHFFCLTNQQQILETGRRHGEFSMVVEAEDKEIAYAKFKERVLEFRKTSDFFEGDCRVYFLQLLEFDSFPREQAMMLNYKSTAGDPIMPFIGCSVPSDGFDFCRIHDWNNNQPAIEGEEQTLFLEFSD
jgi:hypothetical protein